MIRGMTDEEIEAFANQISLHDNSKRDGIITGAVWARARCAQIVDEYYDLKHISDRLKGIYVDD